MHALTPPRQSACYVVTKIAYNQVLYGATTLQSAYFIQARALVQVFHSPTLMDSFWAAHKTFSQHCRGGFVARQEAPSATVQQKSAILQSAILGSHCAQCAYMWRVVILQ